MRWLLLSVVLAPLASFAEESTSAFPPPSAALLAPRPRSAAQPSLHPAIVLRDALGTPVVVSGGPASASKTCDGCHDVEWIKSHDRHGALVADGFARTRKLLPAGNCFLCHVRAADNGARVSAIADGNDAWIETATLASTTLLARDGEHWLWQRASFASDGSVPAATLGIGRPDSRTCGSCHGSVHDDARPLRLEHSDGKLMTEYRGVIFSGQRISDSAMNLADKDRLTRPWDVHAERMVSCAGCHFSPNHPAYAFADHGLQHLQFDARRVAITDYLRRPDHRLASRRDGNIRRCESCHDAGKVHGFLPRAERHFAALSCESCHVPAAHAPARQEEDWTLPLPSGGPRVVYRGVRTDGFTPGFNPVLLHRSQADGSKKLVPNNVVTTYRWIEQDTPVAAPVVARAFTVDDGYRPELVRALDRNGNGALEESELILDSANKVEAAKALLVAAGARTPEIAGEVRTYEIHHGVSPGRFATRDCATCHGQASAIDRSMVVATSSPFGVAPRMIDASVAGELSRSSSGDLVLSPASPGLHVFGHTRSSVLDGLGILLFAGTVAGASGHALLRIRGARRRNKEQS
jgi:hypothetical protein